jgi:hypothetical protein
MSEPAIHIYRARSQRATRFVDECTERRFIIRHRDRKLLYARCCNQRRWAKYLTVQVYYDYIAYWCAYPFGCHKVHLTITDGRKRGANCHLCSRERARRWCEAKH